MDDQRPHDATSAPPATDGNQRSEPVLEDMGLPEHSDHWDAGWPVTSAADTAYSPPPGRLAPRLSARTGYPRAAQYPPSLGLTTPTEPGSRPANSWGQPEQRSPVRRLAGPFPLWLSTLLFVGAFVLLALLYSIVEVIAHGDWSDGARTAGIAGLALAAVALLVLVARLVSGRRAISTIALGLLMVAILIATGVGGITYAAPLHGIEARSLEQDNQWPGAIREYQLSGETAPSARDIARVYDEWGEQSLARGRYDQAAITFETVVSTYARSGAAYDRAQQDLFKTYSTWLRNSAQTVVYPDAIAAFVAYRTLPACVATCQTTAQDAEAQARFLYGSKLAGQTQYNNAITQFETVQVQFSKSQYAKPAHIAAAKAYDNLGQQQLKQACSDAVPTYQALARKYSDTPEGKKAQAALAAPQRVTGKIINYPNNPLPTILLSRSADPNNFSYSKDYSTTPGNGGDFVFNSVAQGNYNIATLRSTASQEQETWYQNGSNLYTVHVGPLCPTNFGTYNYKS